MEWNNEYSLFVCIFRYYNIIITIQLLYVTDDRLWRRDKENAWC